MVNTTPRLYARSSSGYSSSPGTTSRSSFESCSSFDRTAKLETPCTTPSSHSGSSSPRNIYSPNSLYTTGNVYSSGDFHSPTLPPLPPLSPLPRTVSAARAVTSAGPSSAATSATHSTSSSTLDDLIILDGPQPAPEEDRISILTNNGVGSVEYHQPPQTCVSQTSIPPVHTHYDPSAQPAMFTASGGNQPSYPPSFASTITQEPAQLRWNPETELHSVSKSLLRLQKYSLILGIVTTNALLIWSAWTYSDYYYIFLPILCANTFLQAIMIVCIVGHAAYSRLVSYWKDLDAKTTPNEPEKMVMVLPCYNETREEIEKSLDSLVAQKNIDNHLKLIFVIVDGNAKGPGMEKTTQEHLLHDILPPTIRTTFTNGYRARDGLFMPVTIQSGTYAEVPYILLAKRYNQGKRDSLCFIRSFLFHYHRRSVGVETMFHPELFGHLAGLLAAAGLESVDYLVGMDADTVFDEECVWEMVKSIRRAGKGVVGVCGHVCVAFEGRGWGFWDLYQSLEYSLTQGLRRMFQARITGKVNCLPGCCQLLRVEEATFGDTVLREKFGYVPKPNDGMTLHIMGNYSEDSIHASVIFSSFPTKRTTQTLRAKAYTAVPQNWRVFLSQRKRWSLGSVSNEFVMIFRPGIILVERLQSIITVITWWCMPFILAAVIALVMLLVRQGREVVKDKVMMGLSAVLLLRYVYSFCLVFWLPRNWKERAQFVVGYFMHMVVSPFVNFVITVYSMAHSDDFKWGKTREVVEPETEGLLEGDEKRPTMV